MRDRKCELYRRLQCRSHRPVLGCVHRASCVHRIASHRIASHRIASHRIASHRIASHRIASHRIRSDQIRSDQIRSYHIKSDHIIASCFFLVFSLQERTGLIRVPCFMLTKSGQYNALFSLVPLSPSSLFQWVCLGTGRAVYTGSTAIHTPNVRSQGGKGGSHGATRAAAVAAGPGLVSFHLQWISRPCQPRDRVAVKAVRPGRFPGRGPFFVLLVSSGRRTPPDRPTKRGFVAGSEQSRQSRHKPPVQNDNRPVPEETQRPPNASTKLKVEASILTWDPTVANACCGEPVCRRAVDSPQTGGLRFSPRESFKTGPGRKAPRDDACRGHSAMRSLCSGGVVPFESVDGGLCHEYTCRRRQSAGPARSHQEHRAMEVCPACRRLGPGGCLQQAPLRRIATSLH